MSRLGDTGGALTHPFTHHVMGPRLIRVRGDADDRGRSNKDVYDQVKDGDDGRDDWEHWIIL